MTDGIARTETLDHLEQELGVLVRRVRRVLHERSRTVHPDLQPATYLLLGYVAARGPLRSSTVAESFGIDKGAISRQVQNLEDLGLIERTRDPADGRATLLSVTDDARVRLDEVNLHRRKSIIERLGDWSEDDLAAFVALLARYNAALEA